MALPLAPSLFEVEGFVSPLTSCHAILNAPMPLTPRRERLELSLETRDALIGANFPLLPSTVKDVPKTTFQLLPQLPQDTKSTELFQNALETMRQRVSVDKSKNAQPKRTRRTKAKPGSAYASPRFKNKPIMTAADLRMGSPRSPAGNKLMTDKKAAILARLDGMMISSPKVGSPSKAFKTVSSHSSLLNSRNTSFGKLSPSRTGGLMTRNRSHGRLLL